MPSSDDPFAGRGAVKVVAICDVVLNLTVYISQIMQFFSLAHKFQEEVGFFFFVLVDFGSHAPLLL